MFKYQSHRPFIQSANGTSALLLTVTEILKAGHGIVCRSGTFTCARDTSTFPPMCITHYRLVYGTRCAHIPHTRTHRYTNTRLTYKDLSDHHHILLWDGAVTTASLICILHRLHTRANNRQPGQRLEKPDAYARVSVRGRQTRRLPWSGWRGKPCGLIAPVKYSAVQWAQRKPGQSLQTAMLSDPIREFTTTQEQASD